MRYPNKRTVHSNKLGSLLIPHTVYGQPDLVRHFAQKPVPLKSARIVKPAAGEKHNCFEIECDMGKVL